MTFAELEQVNAAVNAMPYRADVEQFGRIEWWERATAGGDCDDYMVMKFRRLLELGWPVTALRFAMCHTETGEAHGVLLADLNGQTWVLDNRQPRPERFQNLVALGYRFDRIQVAGTQQWRLYEAAT